MTLFLLKIFVAMLPAVILLLIIYSKDKYQREPFDLLWKGFGYGVLSALAMIIVGLFMQLSGLTNEDPVTFWDHLGVALFEAAIPEELVKFLFLWLLLRGNRYYDEYFDGIVYAASVGLGFAAFENIFYVLEESEAWLEVGVMRAIFSVPGHFMFAIAMGYFYSLASFGEPSRRGRYLALAIAVPILLHTVFDAILMASEVLAGSTIAFLLFYFFLVVKSTRRGRDHLALDGTYFHGDGPAPGSGDSTA